MNTAESIVALSFSSLGANRTDNFKILEIKL